MAPVLPSEVVDHLTMAVFTGGQRRPEHEQRHILFPFFYNSVLLVLSHSLIEAKFDLDDSLIKQNLY